MTSVAFKAPIVRTPSIRPHRSDVNTVWVGDATYTVAECQQMITDMNLAVAMQQSRARGGNTHEPT